MKKILFTVLACVTLFVSCRSMKGNQEKMRAKSDNRDDLQFALGTDVSQRFTGTAYFNSIINLDETYHFPQTNVITFGPGGRSDWHVHGGMSVIGVGGVGLYQEEGKPAIIIRKGDVVQIPAGVKHWHGATADSWYQQIVVYDRNWKAPKGLDTHGSSVSDEEYAKLEMMECPDRVAKPDEKLMFARAEQEVALPTFNGPVYVSEITDGNNAAGAPGMNYVVFPKGTYNNWHMHKGGQIMIATDGIGYHQVRGRAVEILYPGDVAFCPPGETHWHGGSLNGTFAHIAISTNPDRKGVEWYERLSEETYKKLPLKK